MVSSPCLSPIGAKLTPYYSSKSSNGRMELVILSQPEEQHRARYLTEGSRGAIKDITGMGHPVVKLNGYYSRQPIKLECYIGHDKHMGLPHLFYQASKISGKNSTQCTACKVEGTSVIVMNLLPENGMQATIDCIGILKERNVDVEQKLLNLNHSNKMIDFASATAAAAAVASAVPMDESSNQQHIQSDAYPRQSAFAAIAQRGQTLLAQQQQQQQQQLIATGNLDSLTMSGNSAAAIKFERRDTMSSQHSQIDENSMLSRTDDLFNESSGDVSRQSFHLANNNDDLQSSIKMRSQNIGTNNSEQLTTTITTSNNSLMERHLASTQNLLALNSRKRSVRCRLVFRVKIPETGEILQTTSSPIICTQPLGTPEICRKSLGRAPMRANNLELFIIGKNFLKDSKLVFRSKRNEWVKIVEPEKEFLNSSHMICKIPDYDGPLQLSNNDNNNSEISHSNHNILGNAENCVIEVELQVRSGGKYSEPHVFYYYNTTTTTLTTTTSCNNNDNNSQQNSLTQITNHHLSDQNTNAANHMDGITNGAVVLAAAAAAAVATAVESSDAASRTTGIIQPVVVQSAAVVANNTAVGGSGIISNGPPPSNGTITNTNLLNCAQTQLIEDTLSGLQKQQQQQAHHNHQEQHHHIQQQQQHQLTPSTPQQHLMQQLQLDQQAQQLPSPTQHQQAQLPSPTQHQQQQAASHEAQRLTSVETASIAVSQQAQQLHAQQMHEVQHQQYHSEAQQQQLQHRHQQQQHQHQQQQQQQQQQIQLQIEQQQQQFEQQQRQQVMCDNQQVQTQIILHQHQIQQQQQQQQTVQTSQMLTTIDLNDETTIVYADALQPSHCQQQTPTGTLVQSSMIQSSSIPTSSIPSNSSMLSENVSPVSIDTNQTPPISAAAALATANDQAVSGQQQQQQHFVSHFHVIKQHQQISSAVQHHQHQQFQQTGDARNSEHQSSPIQRQTQFELMNQQIQQQRQQQQQIVLQQQSVHANQLVSSLDLNDDSTVVYADSLHGFPTTSNDNTSTSTIVVSNAPDTNQNIGLMFSCNFT